MRDIHEIINRVDEILKNEHNEPLDALGSYIVGATIAHDDYEILRERYPLLETIAELGAELETLSGSQYAEDVYKDVIEALNQLKRKVEAASADGAP